MIEKPFEPCTEQEWSEARRGQSHSGNKPLQHEDIAAAVRHLAESEVGTRVKVKCPDELKYWKRAAALDHAYRRGISVSTRYHNGWVLIEFTK
jgi:hypothetical protein